MRSLLLFFASLVLCCIAHAQVPSSFNYQSVVRDGFGVLVGSQQLGVKVSIVKDSLGGNVHYSETHSPTTNSNGLFSIQIGEGIATTGVFDSIGWESGGLYYQVEVDMQGGTNYALTSFQPFTSVAYAKVAERALNVDDADSDPTNELQQISLSGDTLSLSNGGSLLLPNNQINHGSFTTNSDGYWVVPNHVSQITVFIFGSKGGNGGDASTNQVTNPVVTGGQGGQAGFIFASFGVNMNDTVSYVIGTDGIDGTDDIGTWNGSPRIAGDGTDGTDATLELNGIELIRLHGGTGGQGGRCLGIYSCGGGSDGADGNHQISAQLLNSGLSNLSNQNILGLNAPQLIITY